LPERVFTPGASDLAWRRDLLAERLTPGLQPLASVAYNYAWSWDPDGPAVFRDINPHRWQLSGENPVRFLNDLWPTTQDAAELNPELLARIEALAARIDGLLDQQAVPRPGIDGPVVFMCAEFGFHASMPIYSGGLGVLAGDFLKEASDRSLEMVGVGLLYRRGYFRQRLDLSGRQQEYWLELDPKSLPLARITHADGTPLLLEVELYGAPLRFQAWRVDLGRVPLLLLDAEVPENDPVQRWTTARLYEGNRAVRLGQYGLLGMGGMRLLDALGIEPAVIHLNEGHPALAGLELAASGVAAGASLEQALDAVSEKLVFTTHTPVAAGNETYSAPEFLAAYTGLPGRLGLGDDDFLDLCRVTPGEGEPGMTPLALRLARSRNGVSKLHGEVARQMWRPVFPGPGEVPIIHVTNGAHLPTFISEPMRDLFVRHLDGRWLAAPAEPSSWEGILAIPNEELWAARCEARRRLTEFVREKAGQDSLQRGEQLEYVRRIEHALEPDALTIGFARRLATYKRIHLLPHDAERARRIFTGIPAAQLIIAGKAHPSDIPGKESLQRFYEFEHADAEIAGRVVIVEDYDISVAQQLVSGCDLWVNLPRKPMEASGTSGMKATFNGALQLSVLDGWWAEAYDGSNGWGIAGDGDGEDPAAVDARDAGAFYDLLEGEVIPLFNDRDPAGVPQEWCNRVKRALVTIGPAFTATRMLDDYISRVYQG
jgi:starch phosphorylase